MSWMDIIHKAKTIRQETAPVTSNRLVPTSLLNRTGLPSASLDVPSLDENVNRQRKLEDQIRRNIEVETKNVRDKIAEQQYLIEQEKRGERILADGTKANTKNNAAYIRARNDEIKQLEKEKGRIETGVRQKSGLKQRKAGKLARDGGLSQNVKGILQNQGTKTPVQSVKNVELPARNVALPSVQGTTPTQDPLVGFAQQRGLMPQKDPLIQTADAIRGRQQPTQNVTRPMGNVPLPDQVGRITDKANELGLNREQMQQVVEQAKEQADVPLPKKPIAGPSGSPQQYGLGNVPLPPKKVAGPTGPPPQQQKVTQEATQQASTPANIPPPPYTPEQVKDAQRRGQAQRNYAQNILRNTLTTKDKKKNAKRMESERKAREQYLLNLGRQQQAQRKKDAKAQNKQQKQQAKRQKQKAKEQARQQKTQQRLEAQRQRDAEKEAQRRANQNPRALVPKDSVPSQSRLKRREEVAPRTRLRQRNPPQPRPQVIKSELSKSIKDILRR